MLLTPGLSLPFHCQGLRTNPDLLSSILSWLLCGWGGRRPQDGSQAPSTHCHAAPSSTPSPHPSCRQHVRGALQPWRRHTRRRSRTCSGSTSGSWRSCGRKRTACWQRKQLPPFQVWGQPCADGEGCLLQGGGAAQGWDEGWTVIRGRQGSAGVLDGVPSSGSSLGLVCISLPVTACDRFSVPSQKGINHSLLLPQQIPCLVLLGVLKHSGSASLH